MIQKFFDQIPINEVYKDLFQPGMKKAGEALATVIDGANLILLPLRLLNEKSKIYFKKNLETYSDKVNKVENLTLIQVPQYVGLPIIEKLTYLNQEDLANAFINLLVKASFEETLPFVHPAYIDILNKMSADEAMILSKIKGRDYIPYLNINISKDRNLSEFTGLEKLKQQAESLGDDNCGEFDFVKYLTGIEKDFNLNYPSNINLYIENLTLNGLIYSKDTYIRNDEIIYQKLEDLYKEDISNARLAMQEVFVNELKYNAEIVIRYKSLWFTEIGKGFIEACIKDINN